MSSVVQRLNMVVQGVRATDSCERRVEARVSLTHLVSSLLPSTPGRIPQIAIYVKCLVRPILRRVRRRTVIAIRSILGLLADIAAEVVTGVL